MDLQNFSSIFEVFSAFNLTYIIIDEVSENTFISVVADKILRKFDRVNEIFRGINSKIAGVKNSLRALDAHDDLPLGKAELKKHSDQLANIDERVKIANDELKNSIRSTTYTSKFFVYLTSFLFLYCLSILWYGGIYDGAKIDSTYDIDLDFSLMCFNLLSSIFLLVGWILDKRGHNSKQKSTGEKIYDSNALNGYKVAFWSYVGIVVVAIFVYLCGSPISTAKYWFHNCIVIWCVVIPVSNFIVYMGKANARSNRNMENTIEKAEAYEKDFVSEIEAIQNYVSTCHHLGDVRLAVGPDATVSLPSTDAVKAPVQVKSTTTRAARKNAKKPPGTN